MSEVIRPILAGAAIPVIIYGLGEMFDFSYAFYTESGMCSLLKSNKREELERTLDNFKTFLSSSNNLKKRYTRALDLLGGLDSSIEETKEKLANLEYPEAIKEKAIEYATRLSDLNERKRIIIERTIRL